MTTIRADQGKIRQTAQLMAKRVSDMKKSMCVIEEQVKASSMCWKGEAGDLYRQIYMEEKESMEKILENLTRQAESLGAIGGNYEKAQWEIEEMTQELPSDVIL